MEAQGYQVTENIFYQDNKSATLLEKNWNSSSIKRTKHINVRLFFIADHISKKEFNVEWCNKNDMIEYFMTKPTQGNLFKKFRELFLVVIPFKINIQ